MTHSLLVVNIVNYAFFKYVHLSSLLLPGFSQYLESGCPKLALQLTWILEFWGHNILG